MHSIIFLRQKSRDESIEMMGRQALNRSIEYMLTWRPLSAEHIYLSAPQRMPGTA